MTKVTGGVENSESFPNINLGKQFSAEAIAKLRADLAKIVSNSQILIGTNGSYARHEASGESDLDFFVICKEEKDVKAVEMVVKEATPKILEVVPRQPSVGGAFSKVESLESMMRNIGGQGDANDKFTRRILYLLEGEWLYNESMFGEIRNELVNKYVRDTITDHQIALFLLNDIIRYYRTICVDFEFKTTEDNKSWGTRNIKLVFSRKLLYFSGVLTVAETYRKSAPEKREILTQLLSMPVVDRVRYVCKSRADRALEFYDNFLFEFSQKSAREECEKATEQNRSSVKKFRQLKNKGHEFSSRLMALLHETYDAGHPIHHALVL